MIEFETPNLPQKAKINLFKMKNVAKGTYEEILIEDGFYVLKIQNETEDKALVERDIDSSFIQFHFCLKGSSQFLFNQGNYHLEVKKVQSIRFLLNCGVV